MVEKEVHVTALLSVVASAAVFTSEEAGEIESFLSLASCFRED